MMTKKASQKPAVKNTVSAANAVTAPIQQIEKCIEKDCLSLDKAYLKALSDTEKSIQRVSKTLDKARKQAKNKKSKPSLANKVDVIDLNATIKELDTLKGVKASLSEGYKKFSALQKAKQQLEKDWDKKAKTVGKGKKSAKRSSRTKTASAKSVASDSE